MSYSNGIIKSQAAGGAFTIAALPSANQMLGENIGTMAFASDGGLFTWNGSVWQSANKSLSQTWSSRPLQVGVIGDSIVRNGTAVSSTYAANVGIIPTFAERAWFLYATQLFGRRMWCNIDACEGYSGMRVEQIANLMLPSTATRLTGSAYSGTAPIGVLACKPDICFVLAGTNNISSLYQNDISCFLQGHRLIWSRLRNAGIMPVVISLLPRSSPATNASLVPSWNAALANECSNWGIPFIDVYTNCAASIGGGWKTGYALQSLNTADVTGLHPGFTGCMQMAQDIYSQLGSYMGWSQQTSTIFGSTSYLTATGTQQVTSVAVNAGGSGYNVGDILTLTNSNLTSNYTPAVLQVATLTGSAIASVNILSGGSYPSAPSNPVGITSAMPYGTNAGGSGTNATFNLTLSTGQWDSSRKGEAFNNFDSGVFTSTTGWTPRYDPNSASKVYVGATPLSSFGNTLTINVAAPTSAASNYADWWGPGTVTVTPGSTYAFFGKFNYIGGSQQDQFSIGLQGTTNAGNMIWSFGTGESTAASTVLNSFPNSDFYAGIIIPPSVTVVRPFIITNTYWGNGSQLRLANLGLAQIA